MLCEAYDQAEREKRAERDPDEQDANLLDVQHDEKATVDGAHWKLGAPELRTTSHTLEAEMLLKSRPIFNGFD